MIPIRLTIKGINSYRNEQSIEFGRLLDSQLFGIFGPVGSGKSTILEAMMLAIYGDTERLNRSGDNRNYNLMNLRSDDLLVDFEFSAGHPARVYRCVYTNQRHRKVFEKVQTPGHKAYVKDQSEWQPITLQEVEGAVGLNYKNFKRAVIIPQGRFQEFLQLGTAERTRMMQDIFGLDKYDLAAKVKSVNIRNELSIKEVEGGLNQFAEIDEEVLQEERHTHITLQEQAGDLERRYRLLQSAGAIIGQLLNLKDRAARTRRFLQQAEEELERKNQQIHLLQSDFTKVEESYRGIGALQREIEALERLLEVKLLDEKLAVIADRADKQEFRCKELETELQAKVQNLAQLESDLVALGERRKDLRLLTRLENWFLEQHNIREQQLHWQEESENATAERSRLLQQVVADPAVSEKEPVADFSAGLGLLQQEKTRLETVIEQAEQSMRHLSAHRQLEQWAEELQPGEPCPLCGSVHHPEILDPASTAEQIAAIRRRREELDGQLKQIRRTEEKWINWQADDRNLSKRQELAESQLARLAARSNEHAGKWPESKYAPEDEQLVKSELEASLAVEEQFSGLNRTRLDQAAVVEQLRQRLENDRRLARETASELVAKRAEQETLQQMVNPQIRENYRGSGPQAIAALCGQLKTKKQETEEEYLRQQKNLEENIRTRGDLEIEIKVKKNDLLETTAAESKSLAALRELTTGEPGDAWLAAWLETPDPENFHKELHRAELDFKSANDLFLEQGVKIARLEKDFEQKGELAGRLRKLLHRKENLQVLLRLFKGSGFVEYISGIYLRDLCTAANERFFRLTRQRMKLEINEKNQFVIRDILNQGKIRSAKTLSGGQLFQASLSLALALAENVRRQSGFANQFFFIDEGFGTQDEASLQLVIETLKSLRKEGRMVGVISHLEALQEEIDLFLQVRNDEVEGSSIRPSWKS